MVNNHGLGKGLFRDLFSRGSYKPIKGHPHKRYKYLYEKVFS